MAGRSKKSAAVPVASKPSDGRGKALLGAVLIALAITGAASLSFNADVQARTANETVWRIVENVPGGTAIPSSAVQAEQVPAGLANLLYTGKKSPAGHSARVALLAGALVARAELGGQAVALPVGDVGVWVPTSPNQDGMVSLGELVLPYAYEQSSSQTTPSSATALTKQAVEIVAMTDSNGNAITGGTSSSAVTTDLSPAGMAPVAVELAVPAKTAAQFIAASQNKSVVLAVPGGVR